MASRRSKASTLSFNLRRFASFLKIFLRNKRALLGLIIVCIFLFLAVGASLVTPFNALGEDPSFIGYVAGKYAAPTWIKQLPTILGGNPTLSENMEVITHPSALKPWPEGQLNYTLSDLTSLRFDPSVNYPYNVPGMIFANENGSLEVAYDRDSGTPATAGANVTIWHEFNYPYGGPPGITMGNIELLVNGTRRIEWHPADQWYIFYVENRDPLAKDFNVSMQTSSRRGIYVAATTNITQYFGTSTTVLVDPKQINPVFWLSGGTGYHNWQEWLNGTMSSNGTALRPYWDSMSWVVSNGSLTTRTYDEIRNATYPYLMYDKTGNVTYYSFMNDTRMCDPYLNGTGSGPHLKPVQWVDTATQLSQDCEAGSDRLYVESTEGFVGGSSGDYLFLGPSDREEYLLIRSVNVTGKYFNLVAPVVTSHAAGESVIREKTTLSLYQNLMVKGKSRTWVLVKIVLTDPEQTYSLAKMQNPAYETAVYNATKFNWPTSGWLSTSVSPWVVSRKTEFLDVPVGVKVFLGPADWPIDKMPLLFPIYGNSPKGFTVNAATKTLTVTKPLSGNSYNDHWILSRNSRSNFISLIQIELAYKNNQTFPVNPGRYRLVVQITFMDKTSIGQSVSTAVHVDDLALKLLGSSYGLLGTDQFGRDLYSQLIFGTRISLYIGITVAVMSVAIGVVVGLVSGYVGGAVDQALMRFNDLLLVLPGLPLLIVLVAVLGANIENLILLLGLLGWNGFARVVRSQVLSLKERPFIEAAKAAGAGTGHIIVRHVLPNVMALVYVSLATSVPGAITAEAALAFLGFYDPNRMSWGRMLHEVFAAGATRSWWWILPPGICIALIATAFILLGYALDEVLNPKLRMRR